MIVRLGYVALSKTINSSFKTLSYTNFQKLKNQKIEKLENIIDQNFKILEEILNYNIKNDITFYRMTSNLFPLATHPNVKYKFISNYHQKLEHIGKIINQNKMRVGLHIMPCCILNSLNEEVITTSINILNFYQNMLDAMKIDSYIIMHIGSKTLGKKESISRFKTNFNKLNNKVKQKIVIENDDVSFDIIDTLQLAKDLKIPMVLDYHHYICNHQDEQLKDYIDEIFKTWDNTLYFPKIHFSSPKNKKEKKAHHEDIDVDTFIEFIESIKGKIPNLDVMIEAKGKDEALFKLVRKLKYKTNYKFINQTTFIV